MITYLVLLLVGIVILIALSVFLANRVPAAKIPLQVVLIGLIIFLGYMVVESIMKPIRFNQELDAREDATIQRLVDIREAQVAYKTKYNKYTGSFDTLIHFVKTDSFELVKEVQVGEWDQDEMTKDEAFKAGILKRSSTFKPVLDSLFGEEYDIEQMRYIPYADTNQIVMAAGEIETGSKVKVKVFEAYALYEILLNGMDNQLVINHIDERYQITNFKGLKVGSLTEATNNAGNWED